MIAVRIDRPLEVGDIVAVRDKESSPKYEVLEVNTVRRLCTVRGVYEDVTLNNGLRIEGVSFDAFKYRFIASRPKTTFFD